MRLHHRVAMIEKQNCPCPLKNVKTWDIEMKRHTF
jgi:hypothetical protein